MSKTTAAALVIILVSAVYSCITRVSYEQLRQRTEVLEELNKELVKTAVSAMDMANIAAGANVDGANSFSLCSSVILRCENITETEKNAITSYSKSALDKMNKAAKIASDISARADRIKALEDILEKSRLK